MKESSGVLQKFVDLIFCYRYIICLFILISIFTFGFYLCYWRHWSFKSVAQLCTGFMVVLTLFFAVLNYEFTMYKTRNDVRSAREILTYNIAAEWHKAPVKDYQKSVIAFKNEFISCNEKRTVEKFDFFINDKNNIDFKEALKGLFNYFEAIAIAAYRGLIDEDFIREFHYGNLRVYYVDYFFYIKKIREEKQNDLIWINYTTLVERWYPDIIQQMISKELKSSITN